MSHYPELDTSTPTLTILRAVTQAKAQSHPGYALWAPDYAEALRTFSDNCSRIRENERDASKRASAYRRATNSLEDRILNMADHYFGPEYIAQHC